MHLPQRLRGAFEALFAADTAMGDVVARSTDPELARIKLAWWREQLQSLDDEAPPAEPRLTDVAEQLLPRGVKGADVAGLEPGWATLLDEEVDPALVAARGTTLFEIGGRLLGARDRRLAEAGALYALASVGRRGVPELMDSAKDCLQRIRGHRFDRRVRGLTMLARAAARDLDRSESEWDKRRALAMLRHRWTGFIG